MKLSGWHNITRFNDQEFLVTEPGLYFDNASEAPFDGSFHFTLDNGSGPSYMEFVIPNEELIRPVRGLVPNGTRQQNNSITELAVFGEGELFDAAVLGESFPLFSSSFFFRNAVSYSHY
jgi:hypothetical protein